jgi:hypothetical protein
MTVDDILKKYERPATLLGSEPVKAAVLRDLNAQKRSCNRIYGILFAVISLITVISVAAVIVDLVSGQKTRIMLLSAAGIPIPFLLTSMRRLAEQWTQSTLLITLIGHSDERTIQSLINKLLNSKALGLDAEPSQTNQGENEQAKP